MFSSPASTRLEIEGGSKARSSSSKDCAFAVASMVAIESCGNSTSKPRSNDRKFSDDES